MSRRVRFIRFEELDQLLDLYRYLNPDDPDPRQTENLPFLWEEIYNDPNLYYFVMEEDNLLVSSCAMAVIKNLTRSARPYGLIENVVTHKDYRKKGYGTAVLQKAVETARRENCYKVMLMTGSKEEKTLHFYDQAGFQRGVKTGYVIYL